MTDDETPPDPSSPGAPITWRQKLHAVFTVNVGWQARVTVLAALFIVAMQDSLAAGVFFAAFWAVTLQLVLSTTWMSGWLKGAKEADEVYDPLIESYRELVEAYRESRGPAVDMAKLLDLCDEHGVPPEKLAAVVWGDADD